MRKRATSKELPLEPEFEAILNECKALQEKLDGVKEHVYQSIKMKLVTTHGLTQPLENLYVVYGTCTVDQACIYDETEDPSCDDCLLCHEPYERK